MDTKKTKYMGVWLDESDYRDVEAMSRMRRCSMSDVLRLALVGILDKKMGE